MMYPNFTATLIRLRNADLALREKLIEKRQLGEGYAEEMEKMHHAHAIQLNEIIEAIGYPTLDKVGPEASGAAWLILQHAIGQPSLMKKCAVLLANAVCENKVDPKNLAYLTDRIAVFEGEPQLYGTQFDWDENGTLSPNLFDDLFKVNQRRKAIGLNTLEEQTALIQERIKNENQQAPQDFEERKKEMDLWRRKVGWIK